MHTSIAIILLSDYLTSVQLRRQCPPLRQYFCGSTIKLISVQSCRPVVALISDLATVIKSLPTPVAYLSAFHAFVLSLWPVSSLSVACLDLQGLFQLHINIIIKAPHKSSAAVCDLFRLDRVVIRALVGWLNCLLRDLI